MVPTSSNLSLSPYLPLPLTRWLSKSRPVASAPATSKPGTALLGIGEGTASRIGFGSQLYPGTNLSATSSSSAPKLRDSPSASVSSPTRSSRAVAAVLQGPIGQSAETDRTQGVKNILAKNPDIKLLAIQPANWDRTQAYNLMQDWISRYGSEIKGVIAENDDMGIGAIRALEEKGLAGKIPVGGVDAIKDGLREVKSGNMVATNLQNAAIELGMALQATVDLLDNKQVPQTALLNMPVIRKDKVDYYYSQLYVKPQDFLKTLPELIKKSMASGDYASQ
jgi:Periplasmic binding protein domain